MKNITSTLFCILCTVCHVTGQNLSVDWAASFDSPEIDYSGPMVVDDGKNVYSTGIARGSIDFDPGAGVFELSGDVYLYLSKLDSSGSFVWAKQFIGIDDITNLCTDGQGNFYLAGSFDVTTDFDPGPDVFYLVPEIYSNYVVKLNSLGELIWAKNFGNQNHAEVSSFEVDTLGNSYTAGIFKGQLDCDPGAGTFIIDEQFLSDYEAFFIKLDPEGNFTWGDHFTGVAASPHITSIAVDPNLNIYLTGLYYGSVDFDPGPDTFELDPISAYGSTFLCKLDAAGNFSQATQFHTQDMSGNSIVKTLPSGNILLSGGYINTVDFDPGAGTFNLTSPPSSLTNIFLISLSPQLELNWAQAINGSSNDFISFLTTDRENNIHLAGVFIGTADFDPGPDVYPIYSQGNSRQIFMVKLNETGDFRWAESTGCLGDDLLQGFALDTSNNIYLNLDHNAEINFNGSQGLIGYTPQWRGNVVLRVLESLHSGISETSQSEIQLSPNPVEDEITIFHPNALQEKYDLTLRDLSGKILQSQKSVKSPNYQLDLTGLPPGLYLLNLTFGHETRQFKIEKL